MDTKNMPKVELHLHLDGSLNIDDIKQKYDLNDLDVKEKMIADEKCRNLNDYLTKFDFPISILQKKAELRDNTIHLFNMLKEQNVIYAEVRFAPQFHTKDGLTQDEVVDTVINAMKEVDIRAQLILCVMRGNDNKEENIESVNVAKKYIGKGVCAVDLAGAEAIFKTSEFEELFNYVKESGIPFIIHAGEADGPESVKDALSYGAKRIGHGVRAIEDDQLLQYIKDNNITLEVCPTSNIQTCICSDYESHPIFKLYDYGIKTTINTDNMTVSNTTLENEYNRLIETGKMSINDIIAMNLNSIDAAFIDDNEKAKLKQIYLGEIKNENK